MAGRGARISAAVRDAANGKKAAEIGVVINEASPAREANTELPANPKRDREGGYQSAAELRADLARMERGYSADRIEVETPTWPLRFWRRAIWPGVAVLALTLIAVLVWQFAPSFRGRSSALGAPKSLAVIGIEILSQDPSASWLGNGLVDLIATDLAQAKSLDVISTERIRNLIHPEGKPVESLRPGEPQRAA